MAPVSKGREKKEPRERNPQSPSAFGAPSARLSLIGLLPSRARLRFTRRMIR